jgi:hypothetical protein
VIYSIVLCSDFVAVLVKLPAQLYLFFGGGLWAAANRRPGIVRREKHIYKIGGEYKK